MLRYFICFCWFVTVLSSLPPPLPPKDSPHLAPLLQQMFHERQARQQPALPQAQPRVYQPKNDQYLKELTDKIIRQQHEKQRRSKS